MTSRTLRTRRAIALATLVTAAAVTSEAPAATKTWQGSDNVNWSVLSAWAGGALPVANDDVLMGYTGSGSSLTGNLNVSPPALNSLKLNANASLTNFTFAQNSITTFQATTEIIGDTFSGNTYSHGAGTNTVSNLILGNATGGAGTYALSTFGVLNATNVTVGNAGTGSGTFSQSGGTTNVSGHFIVGNDASFSNQVNLSGGTFNLTNTNADLTVGNGTGAAVFNHSGGTINAVGSYVYVGSGTAGFATYGLSASGVLNASRVIVGNNYSGTFNQTGGSANVDNLYLGSSVAGSTGTYNLSAGTLTTTFDIVGNSGRGTFKQSGNSTHNVITLNVASGVGATGAYTLSGGTLNVGNAANNQYGSLYLGDETSSSTFTQTGGTLNASNAQAILGSSTGGVGTFNIKAGNASFDTVSLGYGYYGSAGGVGSFNQTGGTVNITNNYGRLYVGDSGGVSGYYSLTSFDGPAALNVTGENIGSSSNGAFYQGSGTTHVVTYGLYVGGNGGVTGSYEENGGNLTAGGISLSINGSFMHDGGTVTVGQSLDIGTGVSTVPGASYTLDWGTLALAAGATANTRVGGAFSEYAGSTFSGGTLTNAGTFYYHGGTFDATLDNTPAGTVWLDTVQPFVANKGVVNRGTISVGTGTSLGAGAGYIVDNQNTLVLAGGSLAGTGQIVNNAGLSGWGTIGGSGGFTNNDTFTQGAGAVLISNSGTNTNNGSMVLAAGQQLQIASNLTNAGSLALGSALVNGAGSLTNGAAGVMQGPGTVSVATFVNAGTLLAPAGTTRVTPAFTNSGLIQVNDIAANLTGGTISNTGSIQGIGKIANAVSNTGTITPGTGTLTVAGPLTNTGQILVPAGTKLLVTGAFASNGGTVTLQGGTFDSNNQALSNASVIAGYGTLSTGGAGLTNNGSITFTGGNTTVTGPVTNAAGKTIEVRLNPALFTGAVVNNGTFKVTGTTATFAGSYAGVAPSGPGGLMTDFSFQTFSLGAANDGGLSGPGTLVVDPAATVVTSYVRQNSLVATSGTILTRPSAGGGQTSVLSSLTLTGTASLDLADNNMVLDGADATAVTAATTQLRQYLYNGNVTSSIAAGDPQHRLAIGYATSAQLGVGMWGNQAVDTTALLTKMTYLGDANLDGKINADDFALIDRGFTKHLNTWAFGDFNYDGSVTAADYLLIDRVYAQQTGTLSPALLAERESQFGTEYVSALIAAVPEPSSVVACGVVAIVVSARRRRR